MIKGWDVSHLKNCTSDQVSDFQLLSKGCRGPANSQKHNQMARHYHTRRAA